MGGRRARASAGDDRWLIGSHLPMPSAALLNAIFEPTTGDYWREPGPKIDWVVDGWLPGGRVSLLTGTDRPDGHGIGLGGYPIRLRSGFADGRSQRSHTRDAPRKLALASDGRPYRTGSGGSGAARARRRGLRCRARNPRIARRDRDASAAGVHGAFAHRRIRRLRARRRGGGCGICPNCISDGWRCARRTPKRGIRSRP